ncbi:peptidoglycan DD-metalloendopeptidase family protein [Nocardioides sp. GCM10027113]|uniref:peptidoglycan DD-metalloendopeptidase family protein n=1 Tax=unclassified Nocardioides TaxID=2615069 RepID=UPI0036184C43
MSGLVVSLVVSLGLSLGLGAATAYAAPVTDFQMPFPCGEEWTGTTRDSHSPSRLSIDWNRVDDLGDPVVAAAPGVVTTVVRGTTGYGNWVRVTHAEGESSLYAHLETIAVAQGQAVDQAALIGTVGSTGRSTGPHLHFEERDSQGVVAPYFDGVPFVFGSTLASRNCVDVPVAGNFLGTPEAEVAVFRRAAAAAFQVRRPNGGTKVIPFGTSVDAPVVGDWDGDGRANAGVRTPATKTFQLSTPAGVTTVVFGSAADLPVAGDWDGDGLWEVGVRRASRSLFRLRAADGTVTSITLGDADDLPVTGDWDGDGRTDVGVFDSATATFTLRITDQDGLAWTAAVPFGQPGDLPVTGDWDANGRTDVGTWTPTTAVFSARRAPSPVATTRRITEVQYGDPR